MSRSDVGRKDRPRVRIDAGWNVDGDDRCAARSRFVDGVDGRGLRSGRRPRKATSEDRIHHRVSAPEARRIRDRGDGTGPRLRSRERVALQLLASGGDDHDGLAASARGLQRVPQEPRADESVASVVPRSAEDGDPRRSEREHLAGHGGARALHQHPGGKTGLRCQPIELALLGGGEEPHPISSFMSRTARSIPTSTALQTIE